jgi:integrase
VGDNTDKIKAINARLKAAYMGVSVLQRNNKIYIRSSLFPPKPGSEKTAAHRQELAIAAYANPAGLKYAEDQAKLIAGQLATKTFTWEPWIKAPVAPETVADWVEKLKEEVLSRCQEITWKKDYEYTFAKLPQNEPLTVWMLRKLIADTAPNSKSRKRVATACNRLARVAGLEETDFRKLAGNYGIKSTAPRKLPSDEEILQWYGKIGKPRDRWAFGMLAVYGIRPHELFMFNVEEFRNDPTRLEVLSETKTGARVTWAFMPEWVEQFKLLDMPEYGSSGKDNSTRGQNLARWFKAHGVPFHPYDLRHAWAVRCIHLGLSDTIAAKMMGHSVAVHQQTYQNWLQGRDFENAVAVALQGRRGVG